MSTPMVIRAHSIPGLTITVGADGRRTTADGTVVEQDGVWLRVRGPERDVLVMADGAPLARARGADLIFDVESVLDRRRRRGGGGVAEGVAADRDTGIRHRYETRPPV